MADISTAANTQELAALVDGIEDYAIFVLDAAGGVVTWNAGARRIKGYTVDDIVGRHYSAFFLDDDVSAGKPQRLLAEAAANGRVADDGWRVRKDGSRFWASVVITALHDEVGVVRGYIKVTRDDTERQVAEQHARELDALREREGLALELNAAVINRVYSAGLMIQGVRQLLDDPRAKERLDAAVAELDAAIEDLRGVLFHFGQNEP